MSTQIGSVVVINVFTPMPDALDDFLAVQIAALPSLRAGAAGARGSRTESAEFAAHRAKILPFIERADPGRYELVYQAGEV
jgi:hypothetical protein